MDLAKALFYAVRVQATYSGDVSYQSINLIYHRKSVKIKCNYFVNLFVDDHTIYGGPTIRCLFWNTPCPDFCDI